MNSNHAQFAPDEWTAKYRLDAHLAGLRPSDDFDRYLRSFIAGPKSLTLDLQMRSALWPDIESRDGIATDVFVWAWGKPENPSLTKIGGTPFLPKSMEWPHDSEGRPLHFIAQFNFSDSTDIVPDLPGDVLLIFCPDRFPEDDDKTRIYLDVDNCHFLFAESGTKEIHTKRSLPKTKLDLWELHGHIYRSSDHPDLYAEYVEPHIEKIGGMHVDPPAVLRGSKIGGVPTWEQEEPTWLKRKSKRRFLCQLMSDRAQVESEDPYIGHPKRFRSAWGSRHRRLVIGDLGCMYLFWDGKKIHCEIQGG